MHTESAVRQKVIEHIDGCRDELVGFLSELVQIPSVFPPGDYEAISERMRAELERIGIPVKLLSAPRKKVERVGLQYPRPNVVAVLEGTERNPTLMIGTHSDVVGVEDPDEWRFPPFAGIVAEDKIWGRGTCDAKCAMAAQVFAARAIVECGLKLKGNLMLVASVDDEGRFDHLKWPGMTYLVEEGFSKAGIPLPDMVINGEASGLESICGSFKGRLILEFNVLGETAHAATPYGINAIDKALALIDAFKDFDLQEGPFQGKESMNLCSIAGVAKRYGDIPETCKVGYEIRVVAPYSTERIRDEMDRRIAELTKSDPEFRLGETTIFSERQPIEISEDAPVVRAIRSAAQDVGIEAKYSPIVGTGELQAFLARGIPGVTYGSGSIARVHKSNEFIAVDELVNQTKIYTLAALDACGFEI